VSPLMNCLAAKKAIIVGSDDDRPGSDGLLSTKKLP
jgi:hypothetical protein